MSLGDLLRGGAALPDLVAVLERTEQHMQKIEEGIAAVQKQLQESNRYLKLILHDHSK